jgi:hypothetical protein
MSPDLKELLFAQLQALSRAYQTSVSIMSAYERETERLDKELKEALAALAAAEVARDAAQADAAQQRDAALASKTALDAYEDPTSAV